MVLSKRAISYLPPTVLRKLQNYTYFPQLKISAKHPYALSDSSKEHSKLAWKEVYARIINGDFFITKPERSKIGGKKSALCWKRGVEIVVER